MSEEGHWQAMSNDVLYTACKQLVTFKWYNETWRLRGCSDWQKRDRQWKVWKCCSVSICVNTHCGFPSAIHVRSRLSPSLVKPSGYVTTIFTSGLSEKKRWIINVIIYNKTVFPSHLQPKQKLTAKKETERMKWLSYNVLSRHPVSLQYLTAKRFFPSYQFQPKISKMSSSFSQAFSFSLKGQTKQ